MDKHPLYEYGIGQAAVWMIYLHDIPAPLRWGLAALLGLGVAKWLVVIAASVLRLSMGEREVEWDDLPRAWPVGAKLQRLGLDAFVIPLSRGVAMRVDGLGRVWAVPANHGVMRVLTAVLFAACAWRFGGGLLTLCAMGLIAALLVLAWIDFHSRLLPDAITLPLTWVGLLVNLTGTLAPLSEAVLGAVAGYGLLWAIFHLFKFFTGREGMGQGDFKLLAALGAWLGLAAVPGLLLIAAVGGATVGLCLRVAGRVRRGEPLPFGPYLAAAGIWTLLSSDAFPWPE